MALPIDHDRVYGLAPSFQRTLRAANDDGAASNAHTILKKISAVHAPRRPAVSSDKRIPRHHNKTMSTETHPTHRELDAKLETIEARMDGRLARIEDKFESINQQFTEIKNSLESQKNTAWKAAAATIAAMIATIIAVAALGFTAFDSGRDTAKMTSEAQSEISASVAEVKQMIQEIKSQQSASK